MAFDFKQTQAEFAAYIRDPHNQPIPEGIQPVRMAMYHELFFNNIDSFLSSNFPVLRQILSDQAWLELAEDFFTNHRCQTPYFAEIAEEFLDYLQNRQNPADYPFLLELTHYEWVEMALSIAKAEVKIADASFVKNIGIQTIALSPLAWPLVYRFPVQLISTDYRPDLPPEQPTYLIVYRDQQDTIHFLQSTALIFSLLQILEANPSLTSTQYLEALNQQINASNPEQLLREGLKIIQELAVKGIIIPADDV